MLSIFRINLQTVQRKLYREEFNLYRRVQKRYFLSQELKGLFPKLKKKPWPILNVNVRLRKNDASYIIKLIVYNSGFSAKGICRFMQQRQQQYCVIFFNIFADRKTTFYLLCKQIYRQRVGLNYIVILHHSCYTELVRRSDWLCISQMNPKEWL